MGTDFPSLATCEHAPITARGDFVALPLAISTFLAAAEQAVADAVADRIGLTHWVDDCGTRKNSNPL